MLEAYELPLLVGESRGESFARLRRCRLPPSPLRLDSVPVGPAIGADHEPGDRQDGDQVREVSQEDRRDHLRGSRPVSQVTYQIAFPASCSGASFLPRRQR